VCIRCLEAKVPKSLHPKTVDSSHGYICHIRYSAGIICHRHPRQTTQADNLSAIERACKAYHDLFGDMYDPEANVEEWNLTRYAFQSQYFDELRRRYREDWGKGMPAKFESEARKLLSLCFGGFFLDK